MGIFAFFTQLVHKGTGDDPRLPLFKVRDVEENNTADKAILFTLDLTSTTEIEVDFTSVNFASVNWLGVMNDEDSDNPVDIGSATGEYLMRIAAGKGNIFQPVAWLSGATMPLFVKPFSASTTTVHFGAWGS